MRCYEVGRDAGCREVVSECSTAVSSAHAFLYWKIGSACASTTTTRLCDLMAGTHNHDPFRLTSSHRMRSRLRVQDARLVNSACSFTALARRSWPRSWVDGVGRAMTTRPTTRQRQQDALRGPRQHGAFVPEVAAGQRRKRARVGRVVDGRVRAERGRERAKTSVNVSPK